ncbi:hypothetical protein [Frigidibacter sp. RF13]|uniref:hypothetical protein n=1 Tax=Frigidibacter sp. RF13 TaxID=2997340 RepID=UPI00227156F1|nr:hypothetical protein [Frigidibacter sp. RF13]
MRRLIQTLDLGDYFILSVAFVALFWLEVTKPVSLIFSWIDPEPSKHAPADATAAADAQLTKETGDAPVVAPAYEAYRPRIFGTTNRLILTDEKRLTMNEAQSIRHNFVAGPYFGAFYVGADGAWGMSLGAGSPAAARAEALARCLARSTGCRLIAERGPKDRTASLTDSEETLNQRQSLDYIRATKATGPRAFARSRIGAKGYSGVTLGPEQAGKVALRACEQDLLRNYSGYLTRYPCEVVAVWAR